MHCGHAHVVDFVTQILHPFGLFAKTPFCEHVDGKNDLGIAEATIHEVVVVAVGQVLVVSLE